ncbi:hypothetical protein PR202_gb01722 [Eleusine coracana subsp. coracana]|uniref:Methyltransferase type 11 domain-containing protein n=1 Tax=Eleusine coracana subsp. coracana TaxID=191504 RepID=A0AAV5DWS6_ELECO|nr:hypothetical protein PR202_gb01722 [Eleusine coracana subsp. coracana]
MAASAAHSPPAIDRRAQRLRPLACFPAPPSFGLTLSLAPFPRTSCDSASRRVVPPDRRLAKLRTTQRWRRRTAALSASAFPPLRGLGLLGAHSRILCLTAGAGYAVDAFRSAGLREVAGVDLVEFPPLVRRGDPHRLPFSNGAFDLVFSDDPRAISGALFPTLPRGRGRARRHPSRRWHSAGHWPGY